MAEQETKATTDHDIIRNWAEQRGGKPAHVEGTGSGNDPGLLRIEFSEVGDDENLEEISWEAFFDKFDDNDLAMLYQDETKDGETSRFFKFVNRDTARDATGGSGSRPRA